MDDKITPDTLAVVMTTVGSETEAHRLAHTLVAERYVACAQVLPGITSYYRWQGSLQTDAEFLILLKLPATAYPRLEQRLRELHPYAEPEILALAATQVSTTYLAWARDQVG
ncbi:MULTISPECIES: divalent-cation tolerance protein CutA [unclassified Synechococcus]|jgi:periplasmic divalent cation tolerance protein|uniref:divalent-cation tolerance protein CutA n=1 Tax=unclassified Synechococcus TaxID=2626047 RepID=UPI0039C1BCF9